MTALPETIRDMIILDSILLQKIKNGWKDVHNQLTNSKTFLKETDYIFTIGLKFENVIRMPAVCLYDIFSTDEYGNYLDDTCQISYL